MTWYNDPSDEEDFDDDYDPTDDGGEGDELYDRMRDDEMMAPYEAAIERGEIGPGKEPERSPAQKKADELRTNYKMFRKDKLDECMEKYGSPIMTEHNYEDFDDF